MQSSPPKYRPSNICYWHHLLLRSNVHILHYAVLKSLDWCTNLINPFPMSTEACTSLRYTNFDSNVFEGRFFKLSEHLWSGMGDTWECHQLQLLCFEHHCDDVKGGFRWRSCLEFGRKEEESTRLYVLSIEPLHIIWICRTLLINDLPDLYAPVLYFP